MGMAASQARFLGLTARKTNVEYEGQQINQQRTCLSNQSANYYNDMLGMSVPTPPSVDQFTKTVYSFNDGAITNQITALMASKDKPGEYTISYLSTWEDDFTPISAATSMVVHTNDNKYMIGATTLRRLGEIEGFTGTTAPGGTGGTGTPGGTETPEPTPDPEPTPTPDPDPEPTPEPSGEEVPLTKDEEDKLQYAYINPLTMENESITKSQYESGAYDSSLIYAYLIDESKTGADAITICYKNDDGEWVKEGGTSVNPQVEVNEEVEPATVEEEPVIMAAEVEPITMYATEVYNDPYLDSLS